MTIGPVGIGANILVSVSAQLLIVCTSTDVHPGTQLKAMLNRACEWAKTQREAADSMSIAWSQSVPAWRKMLLEFKEDRSNPNPFENPDASMSVRIIFVAP
jgi:hypothetical protein